MVRKGSSYFSLADVEDLVEDEPVILYNLYEKSAGFASTEERLHRYRKFARDNAIVMDGRKLGRYWVDTNRYIDVNVFDPQSVRNAEDLVYYLKSQMGLEKLTVKQREKRKLAIEKVANS